MENKYIKAKKVFLNNRSISISKIAEQVGMDRKKLSKMLKEEGLYRGKGYTKEFLLEASKMINKGKGITIVAKELGVDRFALSRALVNEGLYKTKHSVDTSKYETDEVKSMIKDFQNKMNKFDIMEKYNISEQFMYSALRHNGIKRNNNKKYNVNSNYFDVINTEDRAYWLGFLYADGYVYEAGSILEIGLGVKDRHHIEKFLSCIDCNSPIKERESTIDGKTFISSRVQVCDKTLVNNLSEHGCYQAKSLTLEFPNTVPNDLIHHFIRGYFDGDGSIHGECSFSIVGTENLLDKCVDHMNLHHNKKQKCGKAYEIRYHGRRLCKTIYNYLYKDATVYLERKRDKFLAVLG